MTSTTSRRTFLSFVALAAVAVLAVPRAAVAASPDIEKTLKGMISSIRYAKDDAALKAMEGEKQGAFLMGDLWEKGTPEQRTEFVKTFHALFAALGFTKLRENFQYLENSTYEKPAIDGDKATCKSTIVVALPTGRKEYKVEYALVKAKDGWKVVDVTVLGAGARSTLTEIRDNSAFKTGDFAKTLELMKKRLEGLPKKS